MTSEPTGFLYPFIEGEEHDSLRLITDLAASAQTKIADSQRLTAVTLKRHESTLDLVARGMAERLMNGGRIFAFGNGGSSTDAEGLVELFRDPPRGQALPAMSLVDDRAVITALANDVGFDLIYSRQIIAQSCSDDIAIGFSTSGDSPNVVDALVEANRRGLLTIGLAGYEGGAMAGSLAIDHCLVVRSDSVHRIQEAQDALVLNLWERIQSLLSEGSLQ